MSHPQRLPPLAGRGGPLSEARPLPGGRQQAAALGAAAPPAAEDVSHEAVAVSVDVAADAVPSPPASPPPSPPAEGPPLRESQDPPKGTQRQLVYSPGSSPLVRPAPPRPPVALKAPPLPPQLYDRAPPAAAPPDVAASPATPPPPPPPALPVPPVARTAPRAAGAALVMNPLVPSPQAAPLAAGSAGAKQGLLATAQEEQGGEEEAVVLVARSVSLSVPVAPPHPHAIPDTGSRTSRTSRNNTPPALSPHHGSMPKDAEAAMGVCRLAMKRLRQEPTLPEPYRELLMNEALAEEAHAQDLSDLTREMLCDKDVPVELNAKILRVLRGNAPLEAATLDGAAKILVKHKNDAHAHAHANDVEDLAHELDRRRYQMLNQTLEEEERVAPLTGNSFGVFTPDNGFRQWCHSFVFHPAANAFVSFLILFNTVCFLVLDPQELKGNKAQSQLTYALGIVDLVAIGVYMLEYLLKMVAIGVWRGPRTLFGRPYGPWFVLDFLMILLSLVFLYNGGQAAFKVLRAFRGVRFLRSMNQGVRMIVNSLVQSLHLIQDSLFTLAWALVVYSILGHRLFSGVLHNRCALDCPALLENVTDADTNFTATIWEAPLAAGACLLTPNATLESLPTVYCNPALDVNRAVCPAGMTCLDRGAHVYPFIHANFDTAWGAFLLIFHVLTFSDWADLMYAFQNAYPGYQVIPIVYFVSIVMFIAWLLINIFVAVINTVFARVRSLEEKSGFGDLEAFKTVSQKLNACCLKLIRRGEDAVKEGAKRLSVVSASRVRRLASRAKSWTRSRAFEITVNVLIFINLCLQSSNHRGKSDSHAQVLEISEHVFAGLFTAEILIRIFAARSLATFLEDRWNTFDLMLVLLSLIALYALDRNVAFLRSFRIFRVVKMVQKTDSQSAFAGLRSIVENSLNALVPALNSLFLFCFGTVIFAGLGRYILAGEKAPGARQGGRPFRETFDTFPDALLTLFILTTADEWYASAYYYMDEVGWGVSLFFCTYYVWSAWVMLSLFTTVILEAFESSDEEKKKRIKEMKIQGLQGFRKGLKPPPKRPGGSGDGKMGGPDGGVFSKWQAAARRATDPSESGGWATDPSESGGEGAEPQARDEAQALHQPSSSAALGGFVAFGSPPQGSPQPSPRGAPSPIGSPAAPPRDQAARPAEEKTGATGSANGGESVPSLRVEAAAEAYPSSAPSPQSPKSCLTVGTAQGARRRSQVTIIHEPARPESEASLSGPRQRSKSNASRRRASRESRTGSSYSAMLAGADDAFTQIAIDDAEAEVDAYFDPDTFDVKWERNPLPPVVDAQRGVCLGGAATGAADSGLRWRANWSFFIFPPNSRLRAGCDTLVGSKLFEGFVFLLIVLSCATAVAETYLAPVSAIRAEEAAQSTPTAIEALDTCLVALFTMEFLLKAVAKGFLLGRGAYIKDPWNAFDFVLLVLMLDLVSGAKVLRVLRCFRPLRLVRRMQRIRNIMYALWKTIPMLMMVILVMCYVFFLFGLVGLELFMARLDSCNDVQKARGHCTGEYAHPIHGVLVPRVWSPPRLHFDDMIQATNALTQVASLSSWKQLMYRAVDITTVDGAPEANNNQSYALFFVVFIFIGTFYLINIFIGVIVMSIREEENVDLLTDDQRNWRALRATLDKVKPAYNKQALDNWVSRLAWRLIGPQPVQVLYPLLLVVYLVVSLAQHDGNPQWLNGMDDALRVCLYVALVLDVGLRLVACGAAQFFYTRWRTYDFVMLLCLTVVYLVRYSGDDGLRAHSFVSFLQHFLEVARLLRLIKYTRGVRLLLSTLWSSFFPIFNCILLLLLFLFIWGLSGHALFGRIRDQAYLNGGANFRTFHGSLLVLFKIVTLDQWNDTMFDCQLRPPYCTDNAAYHDCGPPKAVTYFFFLSFFFIGACVLYNLLIGIIIDEFAICHSTRFFSIRPSHIDEFKRLWAKEDTEHDGGLPRWKIVNLVRTLEHNGNPLGFSPRSPGYQLLLFHLQLHEKYLVDGAIEELSPRSKKAFERARWRPSAHAAAPFRFTAVLLLLCTLRVPDSALMEDERAIRRRIKVRANYLYLKGKATAQLHAFVVVCRSEKRHPELADKLTTIRAHTRHTGAHMTREETEASCQREACHPGPLQMGDVYRHHDVRGRMRRMDGEVPVRRRASSV
eukprot:TRINITY_DN3958_c2_g1_i1.p1 TRINITY_DN3958_c2_g1~~TRINITY_DN3958_c2_g1_i1.p1  ORF type:complete len:2146 (+),score=626.36 TRINITY_DN3958_c2_g1_i1:116-6553(+)